MNTKFNLGLEELISSTIQKSISEAFRKEKQQSKKEPPQKKIGGIELAVEVTGLAKPTIYSMTSKDTIPYFKRGGKLYFNREKLISWLEEGNSNPKTTSDEK